jgi:predicted nuclease of predicted toxin-antitoxin system
MKLLLDQGLPRSVAATLREVGVDTIHVGEIGMATALDEEIIAYGRAEGRIVVTLDADFHAILALSGAASPSVIRLRIERVGAAEIARRIRVVIGACHEDLVKGAMVTADLTRIRLRRLPVGR